jgi:hypothetical protein
MLIMIRATVIITAAITIKLKKKKLNSMALACKQTIPIERPLLVGEVSAGFCG